MRWQESGRRWGGWLGGIIGLFVLSCGGGAGVCVNGVQLSEYNPSGLQCTKACDCSNLKYEGYCIGGLCIASPRNAAQRKGEVRSCKLLQKVGTCEEGTQEAQPTPLKELLWGDCVPPVLTPENTRATCLDGKDNDCNGLVDLNEASCAAYCQPGQQDPCYTGSVESLNQGRCRAGIKTCSANNEWGGCVGEVRPTVEVCDAQDDDCNGLIDDGLSGCATTQRCAEGTKKPCYPGLAGCVVENGAGGTSFRCIGACRAGEQRCVGGAWTACTGQVVPQAEACDGKDKDCDGVVDEGCGCVAGTERACFFGSQQQEIGECTAGKQRCVSGSWGLCEGSGKPSLEICDGKDNNCDGVVDEGCAVCKEGETRTCYTGPNNTEGVGVCKSGTETCLNGQWGGCVGESLPAKQEICGDNLDNNCDGQTDEGCGVCTSGQTRPCYTGSVDTRGVGVCKDGTETCVRGKWEACLGEVLPAPKNCANGLDNDCDGKIDTCQICQDGDSRDCFTASRGCSLVGTRYQCVGNCRPGKQKCVGGNWSSTCDGERIPLVESCDWLDNDCDGVVDNDSACFYSSWSGFPLPVGVQNVVFFEPQSGIAFGNNGQIWRTTDGGGMWATVSSGSNHNLFAAASSTDGLMVIVGGNGEILLRLLLVAWA